MERRVEDAKNFRLGWAASEDNGGYDRPTVEKGPDFPELKEMSFCKNGFGEGVFLNEHGIYEFLVRTGQHAPMEIS